MRQKEPDEVMQGNSFRKIMSLNDSWRFSQKKIQHFKTTGNDGKINNIFEKGSYLRTFGCFSEYRYIESENVYNIYDTKIGSKLAEKNLETTIDLYAE